MLQPEVFLNLGDDFRSGFGYPKWSTFESLDSKVLRYQRVCNLVGNCVPYVGEVATKRFDIGIIGGAIVISDSPGLFLVLICKREAPIYLLGDFPELSKGVLYTKAILV